MRVSSIIACALSAVFVASSAYAQAPPAAPRVVGRSGATQLELSGSFDRSYTASNSDTPTTYFVTVGVGRFLSEGFLINGRLSGSGQFGGPELPPEYDFASTSLYGQFGAKWYFSPQSTTSGYVGGLYSAALTNRQDGDNGSILGSFGAQTAVSPQASFFYEVLYGVSLSTPTIAGFTTERQQHFGVQFGLRFLF
jgi:hypothetical protein